MRLKTEIPDKFNYPKIHKLIRDYTEKKILPS
jgi:hypothetical protein